MDPKDDAVSACGACGKTFTRLAGHGCGDSYETRELREALARATRELRKVITEKAAPQ